jgi:hypothetical protein
VRNPFSRERFWRPQLIAVLLLLAFLGQALYVVAKQPLSGAELGYIQTGEQQLRRMEHTSPHFVSPLISLIAAVPVVATGHTSLNFDQDLEPLRWPARLPFVIIGVLLGGSLWYVTRRLFGNAGAYVALALYCFSSATATAARVSPNIVAMLGVFGIIYIGIALAHTFYPMPGETFVSECRPRWRRVLLLAAAILLALGAAPATALVLVLALAFMLYVAPARRWLAMVVLVVATLFAIAVLWALNGFSGAALAQEMSLSVGVLSWRFAAAEFPRYLFSALWLTHYPALLLFLGMGLAAFLGARRTRYFGNTAPLLVWMILWALAISGLARDALTAGPFTLAYGAFPLVALAFVFVFLGGVAADIVELRGRDTWIAIIAALLLSHAVIGFRDLARSQGSAHPFHVEDIQH